MACGPCSDGMPKPTWIRGRVHAINDTDISVRLNGRSYGIPIQLIASGLELEVDDKILLVEIAPNQHMILTKITKFQPE